MVLIFPVATEVHGILLFSSVGVKQGILELKETEIAQCSLV